MNKSELIIDFEAKGWKVEPEADWSLVSEEDVDGKNRKIYDVDVQNPEKAVGIAKVLVINEGTVNDEGRSMESARPQGWEKGLVPFLSALRKFLSDKEKSMSTVFAITVDDVRPADEVAQVTVYTNSTNDVTASEYIVKRRSDLFTFKKLV